VPDFCEPLVSLGHTSLEHIDLRITLKFIEKRDKDWLKIDITSAVMEAPKLKQLSDRGFLSMTVE
jgi:hypothetical protein